MKEKLGERLTPLFNLLKECSPKSIAGVKDGWDHFTILKSEGISLKLKSLCDQMSESTCNCDYMECTHICSEIIDLLRRDLLDDLSNFVEKQGSKSFYSFLELWDSR